MRLIRGLGISLVLVAAGCSSSTSPSGPGPNQVFLQNTAFNPTTLTVSAGTMVTWSNKDGFTHNVTSSSGPAAFSSGSLGSGATYQFTFMTAGTYQYYCTIHGTPTTGMHATVIVQ